MEADNRLTGAAMRRVLLATLAAVSLLVVGRAAQLAARDEALRTPQSVVSRTATRSGPRGGPAIETGSRGQGDPTGDELSNQDLALLAMACPSSLEQMPPALRKAFTRLAPPHRLTAAREPAGDWLVDPGAWYAPEDATAKSAATAAPPTTPKPPKAPPVEPLPAPEPGFGKALEVTVDSPTVSEPLPEPVRPKPKPGLPPTKAKPPIDEAQPQPPAWQPQPEALPEVEPPAARAPVIELTPLDPPKPLAPATAPKAMAVPEPVATSIEPELPVESPVEPPAPVADKPKPSTLPSPPPTAPLPATTSPATTTPMFSAPPTPEAITPPAPEKPATPKPLFEPPATSEPRQAAPKPAFEPPKPAPSPRVAPSLPSRQTPLGQQLSPHTTRAKPLTAAEQKKADESHLELFAKNNYPSARECAECHKKQYEEWAVSSHAYAYVSPMFHKFEQKIYDVSRGTVGYFCMRCHSPTSVEMSIPRDTPLWEMPEVAREGVTCIACHRVNENYSKTNGERRIVPGDIYAPVYGGKGGDGVRAAIADKAKYKVKTSPSEKGAGQPIHTEGRFFAQLGKAEFCTTCHQVAVHPGIKLEVVWEQYRASPACKKGVTCQHCHMGTVPGVASPYEIGPIAEVGGKHVNTQREHANHVFYGPGFSIAHPGVFPFHKDGNRWRIDQWLQFDWRAGWGTDDFEEAVDEGRVHACFPEVWKEADDRYDAREIIDDNIERLAGKREIRKEVMENGTKVTGPYFRKEPCRGRDLEFDYVVTNINEGHNILTASLGAQPQLWANVVLIGPDGRRLWETGYVDSNGDLADIHSEDVRHGRLPFDSQLFNLQTMFLITGATGTDREFFLPVNISIDQLPQLRPGAVPVSVLNHPPFIRMESRSMAPLGSKRVKYRVDKALLQQPGRYRLTFRMRSRTEPMYFMRFCESTPEMQRSMMEGILDVHPYSVEFWVK